MGNIVDQLIKEEYLKTPRIIDAFNHVKRKDFLPEEIQDQVHLNIPLPIRFGQTISQPLTVAFMLELLQPEKGDTVLDVGTGSGWQAALLAHIVGESGHVYGIERIPQLTQFGKKNVDKYNFPQLTIRTGNGVLGFPEHAPYDKIIVAAAAKEIPHALIAQLKFSGKLLIPLGEWDQMMTLVSKDGKGNLSQQEYQGFQFVSLIEK